MHRRESPVPTFQSSDDDCHSFLTKCSSRSAVLMLVGLIQLTCVAGGQRAAASGLEQSSIDQIDQSFQISVTDPSTHVSFPAVLLIQSATLTTLKPSSARTRAPRGDIYLSLQAMCGPVQNNYANPDWGDFFSNLTPLPATALRYVTASGRSYKATRVNPISQANNMYASTDDGLVDATYYFTVPITNRAGTLIIDPSHTMGVQYTNFVGGTPTALVVGGPTKVALHFPAQLTMGTARSSGSVEAPSSATAPGTTFASLLNFVSTLLGLLILVFVYAMVRKRRRPRSSEVHVIHHGPFANARPPFVTSQPTPAHTPVPTTQGDGLVVPPASFAVANPTESDAAPPTLRVDVLGSLTLTPTLAPASDPVRAIVAYLALNSDRPLALEEIQNAIWPLTESGSDIKRSAMRNYMVDARKAVGEHHLPSASGKPGYQLVDADTDWAEFERLLSQARSADKTLSMAMRRDALRLVRGLPFAADTSRYFTWAFTTSVVYKIVEAVTTTAHEIATTLVLAGDLRGAEETLRQGLLIDPASLTLWEGLTDVLLENADQSLLNLHWRAAGLVLRAEDVVALRGREQG
jgi:DNA-binding SARP family transcriptional activator